MKYIQYPIPNNCKTSINKIWIAYGKYETIIREIGPNTNLSIIFHINQPAEYKIMDKKDISEKGKTIDSIMQEVSSNTNQIQFATIGPHKEIITEISHNELCILGIELKTGLNQCLNGIKINEATGNVINLENCNCGFFISLADRLKNQNIEDCPAIAIEYLNDYIEPVIEDSQMLEILETVRENPFKSNIQELSIEYHRGIRQFNRLFKQLAGLSPKQFAMIEKMWKVIDYMKNDPDLTLQQISETTGYYDQSQMNRDFKILGGITAKIVHDNLKNRIIHNSAPMGLNFISKEVLGVNLL